MAKSNGRITIQPVREFDPDGPIVVDVPEGSTPTDELSKERTALAGHRTGLADERTQLAGQRTTLATLRSHLANERTHLAYLRTAVSLVGFGITLNRFAIYLIQSNRLSPASRATLGDAKSVGLGMVVFGFGLLAWALYRFHRTARDIELGRYHTGWRAVVAMSVVVLILGAVTTIWLFLG